MKTTWIVCDQCGRKTAFWTLCQGKRICQSCYNKLRSKR